MPTPEVEAAKEALKTIDPFAAKNIIPTAWMVAVAMLGGIVSFYGKVKAGNARAANLAELVGELFISGIVGVFTYWLLRGFDVNPYLIAAGVGISGHMGSRAIFMAEKWIETKFDPESTLPPK